MKPTPYDAGDATPVNARCGAAPVCCETHVISPGGSQRGGGAAAAAAAVPCMLMQASAAAPSVVASAFAAGLPSRLHKASTSPGIFAGLDLRQELPVGARHAASFRPAPCPAATPRDWPAAPGLAGVQSTCADAYDSPRDSREARLARGAAGPRPMRGAAARESARALQLSAQALTRSRAALRAEPMLQLLCTVLQAEVAVLTLADGNRLVMRKGAVEVCEPGEPAERAGVWAWAPLPVEQELVVVEDTRLDERCGARRPAPGCWPRALARPGMLSACRGLARGDCGVGLAVGT